MSAESRESSPRMRFWGARGSIPAPESNCLAYGGNTSCLEVRAGDEVFIFDAGSGLRRLGDELLARAGGGPVAVTLLLSHAHWDHLQGLPFFRPLYKAETTIAVLAPAAALEKTRRALAGQFRAPYFPVPWSAVEGRFRFAAIPARGLRWRGARVACAPLRHPQGATAYRLEVGGKSLTHALDHEHGDAAADAGLIALARDSDWLIADAQYTPEEYEQRRGWGHSTWRAAIALARAAGARHLILSHHDPWREDAPLAELEAAARREFPACRCAREGERLAL